MVAAESKQSPTAECIDVPVINKADLNASVTENDSDNESMGSEGSGWDLGEEKDSRDGLTQEAVLLQFSAALQNAQMIAAAREKAKKGESDRLRHYTCNFICTKQRHAEKQRLLKKQGYKPITSFFGTSKQSKKTSHNSTIQVLMMNLRGWKHQLSVLKASLYHHLHIQMVMVWKHLSP
ncbi:hypothetical protein WOLCODRAFT_17395 [Wolfiporia cocos MD-104 SS10]|uniref:Uncharacterized protein n=1 Tax=Wolfiporia cocos (strain MD-104) TaxID=742152 RepID=A0A2H3K0I5_WOLCO|nr:hypothetical protein WOLCODRAFT_17395 [Wolfiporia cocos MD-104 SS10]